MSPAADPPDLGALEAAIGVRFDERRHLRMALTHRSYLNEVDAPDVEDNERLEFLGDALVDFVAGDFLYRLLPEAREGELTALRSALVCEPALAAFARALDLGAFLRMGRGEFASGGQTRSTTLSNTFEALVGAIFLDQGFAAAERFVMGFLEPELAAVLDRQRYKDAKSRFQEYAQRTWQITPRYVTVAESGPDHEKVFVVEAQVGDTVWGHGEGRSKALAAQQAARMAIERVSGATDTAMWSEVPSVADPDARAG